MQAKMIFIMNVSTPKREAKALNIIGQILFKYLQIGHLKNGFSFLLLRVFMQIFMRINEFSRR
jgi:hypothetical protein